MQSRFSGPEKVLPKDLRNQLRGLYGSTSNRQTREILQKVRAACPPPLYRSVISFLNTMPIKDSIRFGQEYPLKPGFMIDRRPLRPLSVENELLFQIARINEQSKLIEDMLFELAQINLYFSNQQYDQCSESIDDFTKQHGYSIILIKKAFLCYSCMNSIDKQVDLMNVNRKEFESSFSQFYMYYIYELTDKSRHPMDFLFRWLRIFPDNKASGFLPLIRFETSYSSVSDEYFTYLLSVYANCSLLDLIFFLWKSMQMPIWNLDISKHLDKCSVGISDLLMDIMNEFFVEIQIDAPPFFFPSSGDFDLNLEAYRMSKFFDEYTSVASWRLVLDKFMQNDELDVAEVPKLASILVEHELDWLSQSRACVSVPSPASYIPKFLECSQRGAEEKFLSTVQLASRVRRFIRGE